MDRIGYLHVKDIDPVVKVGMFANRTGLYDACAQGLLCKQDSGDVGFPAVCQLLPGTGFKGGCTMEQVYDPAGGPLPVDDARYNRDYLRSIGFAGA